MPQSSVEQYITRSPVPRITLMGDAAHPMTTHRGIKWTKTNHLRKELLLLPTCVSFVSVFCCCCVVCFFCFCFVFIFCLFFFFWFFSEQCFYLIRHWGEHCPCRRIWSLRRADSTRLGEGCTSIWTHHVDTRQHRCERVIINTLFSLSFFPYFRIFFHFLKKYLK